MYMAWIASSPGAIRPSIAPSLGRIDERAARCRSANDRNGALVTARLTRVQGMFDVVTGRAGQPKLTAAKARFRPSARRSRAASV